MAFYTFFSPEEYPDGASGFKDSEILIYYQHTLL